MLRPVSWFYRTVLRPVLFARDAEEIYMGVLQALGWAGRHEIVCDALHTFYAAPAMPVTLFGLSFPNPVGLAAGMDKRAAAVPAWAAMGFGFLELGTVTWQAQPGNPGPRLFRVLPDEALVHRLGFNNQGALALADALREWRALQRWPRIPVGVSLGKSKDTPLDRAPEEFARCLWALRDHADFFVVNINSLLLSAPSLLHDPALVDTVLAALQEAQQAPPAGGEAGGSGASKAGAKPLLLKIPPDLSFESIDEIVARVGPRQVAGLVATNTTTRRPESADPDVRRLYAEPGGLSGKPLRARSTEIVRHLYRQVKGRVPIIGVGGVFTAADAWEKITAGASLVEIYTGLVFEGPGSVSDIVVGLQARLEEAGLSDLTQAVGIAAK